MTLPWYVTAVAAALVWGIHYPLLDQALRKISLASVLLLTSLPMVLVALLYPRTLAGDYLTFTRMPWGEKAGVLALLVTGLAGTVLLYVSIHGKNATLASLIEITYPVFVVVFAYVLFREFHVNASVLMGALLVFAGVALIITNNP